MTRVMGWGIVASVKFMIAHDAGMAYCSNREHRSRRPEGATQ